MKILLSGDWHGNSQHAQNVFAHACRVDAEMVFELGDFGFGWRTKQGKGGFFYDEFSATVAIFCERAGIPCEWLPGNHENYDKIEEEILAKCRKSQTGVYEYENLVSYVPRPTVRRLGGLKFLVMGGAASVDKAMRIPGKTWWHQELITDAEVMECERLSEEQGPFDIMLSHDFPWECNVVDRHLDPQWGPGATEAAMQGRMQISKILKASGARALFHGHLHKAYTELIFPEPGRPVVVRGLDRDYQPMSENCYLLDTETFDSEVADAIRLLKNEA